MAGFYLYRIYDETQTLYIGKGSGSRLSKQKRRFKSCGEIIASFDDEREAYAEERRLIAEFNPPLNKDAGGRGGYTGVQRRETVSPHGFSPGGLNLAAPYLAKLLALWDSDKSLVGILRIVAAYEVAHGFDALSDALAPHLKRFLRKDLMVQNNAI